MSARPAALAAVLPALFALTIAHGAELSGDCKPVAAAMEKSVQADHATTTTRGADTMQGITVGGAIYVQSKGAWHKSPMTVQDNLAMSRDNLKAAQEYSCKALPDSVVDGTAVANFTTHTVNSGTVVDSRIAIAKATGLAVSVENRLSGDANAVMVTHYRYGNVKAPL